MRFLFLRRTKLVANGNQLLHYCVKNLSDCGPKSYFPLRLAYAMAIHNMVKILVI